MKKPRIRTVRQPEGSKCCGAACCAMLLGKTLAEVLLENPVWQKLAYTAGIAQYLAKYNVVLGAGFAGSWRPWQMRDDVIRLEIPLDGRQALLATEGSVPGYGHWMVWDGKKIRDPDPDPLDTNYIIDEVWLVNYFDDFSPGDLDFQ